MLLSKRLILVSPICCSLLVHILKYYVEQMLGKTRRLRLWSMLCSSTRATQITMTMLVYKSSTPRWVFAPLQYLWFFAESPEKKNSCFRMWSFFTLGLCIGLRNSIRRLNTMVWTSGQRRDTVSAFKYHPILNCSRSSPFKVSIVPDMLAALSGGVKENHARPRNTWLSMS